MLIQLFQKQAGRPMLPADIKARLTQFYTQQLAIAPSSVGRLSSNDDPFARVGLRFRIKPRAHRRPRVKRAFS